MAALSYMQRRKSGTYEFRRRLPEALAGKAVPEHMRSVFPELINVKTARFKRKVVRSLDTKDLKEAKRRDHREALRATQSFDDALKALLRPPVQPSLSVDPTVIAGEVYVELLAGDEAERLEGDDRRHLQTAGERVQWPDLVAVPPSSSIGMSEDHFYAYGLWRPALENDYREASPDAIRRLYSLKQTLRWGRGESTSTSRRRNSRPSPWRSLKHTSVLTMFVSRSLGC